MPNKLIGTLIALLFLETMLNISTIILTPTLANAQLSALTEIQNGTFHLSHKNMGITSETFKTDKYIDEYQAEYFSDLSKPELNTPADNNYPFTLVDHYILDSDLVIEYKHDNIICSAYPQKAFLSRHNISIEDYTNKRARPTYFIEEMKGKEPLTGEKVTAMHLEVHGYESYTPEIIQYFSYKNPRGTNPPPNGKLINGNCLFTDSKPSTTIPPDEKSINGIVLGTHIRVDSLIASVWLRSGDPEILKRCNTPVKATTCLHPSDIRPEKKWYIVRTGNIGPFQTGCTQDPPLRPRQECYYPFPPERTSAAATNWSYNYNLRNGISSSSSASSSKNSTRSLNSQTTDSSCKKLQIKIY